MSANIILASQSSIRQQMLRNAGVVHSAVPARIDEDQARDALIGEGAAPRDIADTLAEMKARKISAKSPDAVVIGCDQVLSFNDTLLSKPQDKARAMEQLRAMRNATHELLSAVVVYRDNTPLWRHVSTVRMTMRDLSDAYLASYLDRNWESIQHAVGAYKLEEEGIRLFSRIDGDYFAVLGLPLLELLTFLTTRGDLET